MLDTTANPVSSPTAASTPPSVAEVPSGHAFGSETAAAPAAISGLGIAVRQLVRELFAA
jgi:hypothetical protein